MIPKRRLVSSGLTRSVRWVFNSANVLRLGHSPSLLLDFAALNTQRTLLGVVENCSSIGLLIRHGCQGVHSNDVLRSFK